jgi:AhpD family alkylhydroperoxidase
VTLHIDKRLDYVKAAPAAFKAMLALEHYLGTSVDRTIVNLVKLRASQMNGCAFCIDMHWKEARASGETEQRLYGLDAWRESPYYTERERAALTWTEALTNVSSTHAPDDDYALARAHFDDKGIADLTWAVAAINAWNRVAIGFRSTPGVYQPPKKPE